MIYFDYIFYRFAKAYKKWDKDDVGRPSLFVGFMQGMIVSDFILFPLRFFYGREQTSAHVGTIKIVGGIILIVFMSLNYIRYKDMYQVLDAKWNNEKKAEKFYNGILVVFALSFPLVILILFGVFW